MKKVIFGLIATVFMSVSSFANDKSELNLSERNLFSEECTLVPNYGMENDIDIVKSKVSIKLGRASRGCSGFGVCSLTATIDLLVVEIEIIYDPETSQETMALKVTPEFEQELVRYFGKSALILEEDFEVTEPEAIRELGLKNRFVMGKGTYSTKNGRILVKNSVR